MCLLGSLGCAAKRPLPDLVVKAQVAIREFEPAAAHLASREVPWAGDVLTERVSLAEDEPQAELVALDGVTPGLLAVDRRLRAREELRRKLRNRLAALPARDAIPGEEKGQLLSQFAQRDERIAFAVDDAIHRRVEERILTVPRTPPSLEGQLALQGIADVLLASGGGNRLNPRAMERDAAQRALAEARNEMGTRVLNTTFADGASIGDWAAPEPLHSLLIEDLIRQRAELTRSTREDGSSGPVWVVELQLPREELGRLRPAVGTQTGKR